MKQPVIYILRDVFVRSVTKLVEQLLQEHIEKNCRGCLSIVHGYGSTTLVLKRTHNGSHISPAHDLCSAMPWGTRVIKFLPHIIRQLTIKDIQPVFRMVYYRIQPQFSTDTLPILSQHFIVDTLLYIYLDEMHCNIELETGIAQALYSMYRRGSDCDVVTFGKKYREVVSKMQKEEEEHPIQILPSPLPQKTADGTVVVVTSPTAAERAFTVVQHIVK